ncbi:RsmB/NOP family class I SAM-dependent RNA methyltransferase [Falsirhodobacter xinxiangensis]|uniref:RsmB/NOP family class I SAM-dependent RNA methyltransferase n=1 Tax=Falsirhodobacter xinxiangensis TaxID=2530049 RepID=UPI0010AA4E80|nr:transcription antitermination factor NusB [Rhodobacter xinxiangensis]
MTDEVRAAAIDLLGAVLSEGALLAQALPVLDHLPPPDRARAQRLAATTLRHVEQADRVLAAHIRRAPPPAVRDALRLAVTEIALGAAPHGVVNAVVGVLRANRRTAHQAGFANAVLRKIPEDAFAGLPAQRLPKWLRQPLVHTYGRDIVSAIEAVQAEAPPIDLTPRPGATELPEGAVLPTGSIRVAATQVSALPGFALGHWWVQDAAAALAVRLLDPKPGERIADLCAAPGGKTLQLAAAGADVTAVDISAPRLERLAENLTRTGLSAKIVAADVLGWQDEPFDAILLDAPCSATGTIRRHPDLPFVKGDDDVAALAQLQSQMIDHALGLLKPGGRLVFCTCSLLPEEGEAQIAAALTRHSGLRLDTPTVPGMEPRWLSGGGLRLRPDFWADRGGMDGFFMARFTR